MPIRKLSVQLANQIAAGEVVERPASVVKELLENAVDAHASSITLELKQAGKQLIKVSDNGSGIPKDELVLALAPHATSKISCLEDLAAITTMGFRGEALASIASVSRLTLISNTQEQPHAYQVEVSGPEQAPEVAPAAHPVGTSVIVRELFFNTPARRRFLKSDKTEFNHIKELVVRLALVNYGIEFKLVSDGKTVLQVPAQTKAQLPQRIAKLLGTDFNYPGVSFDNCDPYFTQLWRDYQQQQQAQQAQQAQGGVRYQGNSAYYQQLTQGQGPSPSPGPGQSQGPGQGPEQGAPSGGADPSDPLSAQLIQMHGLIIKPPSLLRALPDRILTFLNGRIIADKMVNHALRAGFLSVVQDDPSFKPCLRTIIFLHCDPHIVDVNVHPRKDEVRFHESNLIYDAIVTNVRAALLTHNVDATSAKRGSLDLSVAPADLPAVSAASAAPAEPAPLAPEPVTDAERAKSTTALSADLADSAPPEAAHHAPAAAAARDLTRNSWGALRAKISAKGKEKAAAPAAAPPSDELRAAVTSYLTASGHACTATPPSSEFEGAMVDFKTLTFGAALEPIWAQAQALAAAVAGGAHSGADEDAAYSKPRRSTQSPAAELAQSAAAELAPERAPQPKAAAAEPPGPPLSSASGDEVALNDEEGAPLTRARLVAPLPPSRGAASHFNAQSVLERAQATPPAVSSEPSPAARPLSEPAALLAGADASATAPDGASESKAQFLARVAPNVVLFSHAQRYFMAQGSTLFAHFLAQVYRHGVRADQVERCALTLPFALRVERALVQAYKQTALVHAAARAGFVVKSQPQRTVIELSAIPKMVSGTNLAAVAGQALNLIAQEHEQINRVGTMPEELVKCVTQAKRYELNTVLDAKAMVEHLQPSELKLLVAEAKQTMEPLGPKARLNLSLSKQGFAICELDLCSLAYQMLGRGSGH